MQPSPHSRPLTLFVLAAMSGLCPAAPQVPWPDAYLKPSNTGSDDRFGFAVATSGTTVAVGAWREDSAALGVDGDSQDDTATDAGAVYVFELGPGGWVEEAYLKAFNTGAYDGFGSALALDGDTLVVGCPGESAGSAGDPADDSASRAGAVYVFVRENGVWSQQAYLKSGAPDAEDGFGIAVDLDGDLLVVGAPGEDSASSVDPSDDSAPLAGAAYVFVRSGGVWSQEAYLKAANAGAGDEFGTSVAVSGDTIAVGAWGEDSSGNPANDFSEDSGAAYVFRRVGSTWLQRAYLKASNVGVEDRFGWSLDLDGATLLVGAHLEDGSGTGIDAPQGNGAWNSGAAYVFEDQGGVWTQTAYVKSSNSQGQDGFGHRVALAGDRMLISAPFEDSSATDVNGAQQDDGTPNAGAAYLFRRVAGNWTQTAYLKAGDPGSSDQFGALALSQTLAVVGSPLEDGSAVGPGGTADDQETDAGAVHTFRLTDVPTAEAYCFGLTCPCGNVDPLAGCASSTGQGAALSATGTPIASRDDLVLIATGLPAQQSGLLFMGGGQTAFPFGDGLACVAPGAASICRFAVQPTGLTGTLTQGPGLVALTQGFAIPCRIDPGETWHFQAWYRDPQGPCGGGFSYSNALSVTFVP